ARVARRGHTARSRTVTARRGAARSQTGRRGACTTRTRFGHPRDHHRRARARPETFIKPMRCRLSPVTLLACEARHKLPAACVVVAVLLLGGSFPVAAQPAHPEPGAAAAQPAAAHE